MSRLPPRSTLFPYTTLFRSQPGRRREAFADHDDRFSARANDAEVRSEEHTSELQSLIDVVCRLLLEKNRRAMILQRLAVHSQSGIDLCRRGPARDTPAPQPPSAAIARGFSCSPSSSIFFFLKISGPAGPSPFSHPAPLPI